MIVYDPGHIGIHFVFQWRGSVFPKALLWAIPNAILAVLLHIYARQEQVEENNPLNMAGINVMWAGYTSVLGFLVVFRNNQAYTRFWEGATLINQVRGEWFNAVSTLFAFCNHSQEYDEKVDHFQHTLVRLASMLYCSALQQVCDLDDDCLEIIEIRGMNKESVQFMQESFDRCEVILQWVQRLIVDANEANVIKIAPPLLTRAFQELSRGIVNLNNARKIKDIPFPFPYAQMITVMLVVHWLATPFIASQLMASTVGTGIICFFVTFSFWCLIYIALEIDQPFGEDANDLPLRDMQREFNRSLLTLMDPLAQEVPKYELQHAALKTGLSSILNTAVSGGGSRTRMDAVASACSMSAPSMRTSDRAADEEPEDPDDSNAEEESSAPVTAEASTKTSPPPKMAGLRFFNVSSNLGSLGQSLGRKKNPAVGGGAEDETRSPPPPRPPSPNGASPRPIYRQQSTTSLTRMGKAYRDAADSGNKSGSGSVRKVESNQSRASCRQRSPPETRRTFTLAQTFASVAAEAAAESNSKTEAEVREEEEQCTASDTTFKDMTFSGTAPYFSC